MTEKFCGSCGSAVSGGKFCGSCGEPVADGSAAPPAVDSTVYKPLGANPADTIQPVNPAPRQTPPPVPPAPTPPVVPPAPQQSHAGGFAAATSTPRSEPRRTVASAQAPVLQKLTSAVVVGNWTGAGTVAVAMFGVVALPVFVGMLILAVVNNLPFREVLVVASVMVGSVFGVNFGFAGSAKTIGSDAGILGGETVTSVEHVSQAVGVMPLLVTFGVLALGVWLFGRVTRSCPRGTIALADAARVALFVSALTFVISIVFRIGLDQNSDLLDALDRDVLGPLKVFSNELTGDHVSGSFGLGRLSALFAPFFLVFGVLGTWTISRRDWWGNTGQRVHDWVAPGLRGVTGLLVALSVLGVVALPIYWIIGVIRHDIQVDVALQNIAGGKTVVGILMVLVGALNVGFAITGLGTFAQVGIQVTGSGALESVTDTSFERLPFPWVLIALVGAAIVLAWATRAALKGARKNDLVRHLVSWLGSLVVFVPILGALANFSMSGTTSERPADGDATFGSATASGGLDIAGATVTLVLFAIVVSVIVAVIEGLLDPNEVAAKAQAGYAKAQAASANAYNLPTEQSAETEQDGDRHVT